MACLRRYRTGNCAVWLGRDGTKVISFDPPANPEHPLSIDIKITNRCDLGCPWCHESASADGEHADRGFLLGLCRDLPPGTELAVGGGNALVHPDIEALLRGWADMGLITNMTVHALHLRRHREQIERYRRMEWLYGLGVSLPVGTQWSNMPTLSDAIDRNTVWHCIAGIHSPASARALLEMGQKVLILGYKAHGRGVTWRCAEIEDSLVEWRSAVPSLFTERGGTLAFDTVAIHQLDVRSNIPQATWETHYMGADGEFTMYVDAVSREYAASSVGERYRCNTLPLREMFQHIREVNHVP